MKPTQLLVATATLIALAAQPALAQSQIPTGGTAAGTAAATEAAVGAVSTTALVVGGLVAAAVVSSLNGGSGATGTVK